MKKAFACFCLPCRVHSPADGLRRRGEELISKTPFPEFSETDTEGNIVGAPLIGNVKEQADTLQKRIDRIRGSED